MLTLHDPWAVESGGSQRARAIVAALQDLGHQVLCLHPGPVGGAPAGVTDLGTGRPPLGQQRWSSPLRAVKRRYVPMPTGLGGHDAAMVATLGAQAPVDLLVVGELAGARYHTAGSPTPLWLDFPDLLSAAARRHAPPGAGVPRYTALAQSHLLARSERSTAGRAAIVTAAGWGDAEALRSRAARPVRWLPNPVAGQVLPPPGRSVPTAGFFGNFAHLPNRDGYDILCRSWAPRLRRLGWAVAVAGHGSDRLPPSPGVDRWGSMPTAADFYARVDLTLAPLRRGGGMKVKVVESLVHGRPAVIAPGVLDGVPPSLEEHLTVVDLDQPDFRSLPDAVPPAVAAALDDFRPERFVARVADALAGLPGLVSA